MSLFRNRIYLFTLSLFALVSCENPSEVGLNLQGNNQLGTYFDDKQPVVAATLVQPDSLLAFKSNPILAGKFTDGDFGTVAATHYSEVGLNGTNVTFNINAGATADSMVLVLAYNGYYYGDTTSTIKLNVHKLAENFVDDKTYFTATKLALGQNLGSVTFKPGKNRVKRNGAEFSRLLRIKLSPAFATEILNKSGQSQLSSQAAFRQFWKGIAITPEVVSGNGAIIGLTTFPDSAGTTLAKVAGINLYFQDAAGKKQFHNFSFSGTYYYNGIEAARSGLLATLSPTDELLATNNNNVSYIQENTGIKTRITFPELLQFKNQNPNTIINYAELILPVKSGTSSTNIVSQPPAAVFLYESSTRKRVLKTAAGISYAIQRGAASAFGLNNPIRVPYSADSMYYKADITSYIQALLTEKKPNNGIIVSAAAEDAFTAQATGTTFPGIASVNRTVIPATGTKGVRLKIYYSKIN